jgi:hypothetical protein
VKKRIAQQTQPTEQQLTELASLLGAVLHHPACPDEIADGIDEGMNDIFNSLGAERQALVNFDPAYIQLILKANAK